MAEPHCRRDPATTPHSSRLQVKRYGYRGCGKDCRDAVEAESGATCACARYGADPGTRRTPGARQAAAVSVAPGSRTNGTAVQSYLNEAWQIGLWRHRTLCVDTLLIGATARTESSLPTSERYSASARRQTDTDPSEAMS